MNTVLTVLIAALAWLTDRLAGKWVAYRAKRHADDMKHEKAMAELTAKNYGGQQA